VSGAAALTGWWRPITDAEVVEERDSRVRLRFPVTGDPAAILAMARDSAEVSGFSFEPPSLSDLFVEAVRA
jgi:ABC-2 type transport system ATP-binding protein